MLGAAPLFLAIALGGAGEPAPAGGAPGSAVPGPSGPGVSPHTGGAATLGLVVVLRPIAPDDLTETAIVRVAGELSAARFRVLLLPLEPRADPGHEVETVSAAEEPVAAIAIARVRTATGDAVAIWTCDRRARRTTILRLQTSSTNPGRQAAVLAVEAIELVRARVSGLDTALAAPARLPESPPPPPQSPAPAAATGGTRLTLGLGTAAAWDGGLGGPAWSAIMWGCFRASRDLTACARISAFGSALRVAAPAGTADVHRDAASAGIAWTFGRRDPVDGFLSIAAAVEQLRAAGAAPSPAETHAVTAWSLLAVAGAGVRVHLSEAFAAVAAVEGILAPRRLTLRFDDGESHPFSRPGALLHAGLEATF